MASPKNQPANGMLAVRLADGSGALAYTADNEPLKAAYGLNVNGYVPPATPTDVLVITPSPTAGKILRLRQLVLSGTATSAANILVSLVRRSSANTGGTWTTLTAVPRDTQNDAATAVVQTASANASALGTLVGAMDGGRLNLAPAANGSIDRLIMQWSWLNDQAPTLRAGEYFALNLGGAAWPSGGALDMQMHWCEE